MVMISGNSQDEIETLCIRDLNQDQLLAFNPNLAEYTPATRVAYARFRSNVGHSLALPGLTEENEE